MCQQGSAEIAYERRAELEALRARYQQHKRGEITLSDEELEAMAVKIIMLRES